MGVRHFRVQRDGNGKLRYFIEHAECDRDFYIQQYVKDKGAMPVDPPNVPQGAVVEEVQISDPSADAVSGGVAEAKVDEHVIDGEKVDAETFTEALQAKGVTVEEPKEPEPVALDASNVPNSLVPVEQSTGDETV